MRRKIRIPEKATTSPCDGCMLECNRVPTRGQMNADLLIVGKPPQKYAQIQQKEFLSSLSKAMLGRKLRAEGFDPREFVRHNSVSCMYDKDELTSQEIRSIKTQCRLRLLNVIRKQKPKVIIAVGAEATEQVLGRPVKITKVRGVPVFHAEHNCIVLPIQDPDQVWVYPQHEALLDSDLQVLRRLVLYDYDLERASKDVLGDNYKEVTDIQFLIDRLPNIVSFDVETLGLDWNRRGRKLISLQLCTEEGEAFIIPWDHPQRRLPDRQKRKIKQQLRELLCNDWVEVVGHNLKYDLMWVWEVLGFKFRISHDTLMMLAIMDENLQNKDLDTAVKLFVPEMAGYADVFNSTYDKSRMDRVPWDALTEYGCGDVDAVLRLYSRLRSSIECDDKLWTHYQRVSIPGLNAFASMERVGLGLDETALDEFEEFMAQYVADLEARLLDMIPASIKRAHMDAGLSFTRAAFVRDVLFNHPDGFRLTPRVFTKKTQNMRDPSRRIPSTSSKDHLPYFFEECEFTIHLAEWSKANRLLNTSVRRFREKYVNNGRIYPQYSLWTTVTGRSSSRNPNGQNIPKRGTYAKRYRKLFIPPPGYVLLEADLSQAELRIAGSMANDPTMIDIYQRGGDIHTETAAATMGMTVEAFRQLPEEEQRLARFKAKAINFGFIYGMGWRNFIVYAKTQYGVEFTDDEAQQIRDRFFETYGNLHSWHNVMREFAQRWKYVRSYSGRKRHLPMIDSDEEGVRGEAQRQAINSPVQEFASSLGVMAMSAIDEDIDPQYLQLCGFVHDAIYAYVPEEYVEWGAKTLKWYMENVPLKDWFDLDMPIPIKADVGFGFNAGETHEMGGLEYDAPFDFSQFEDVQLPRQLTPPFDGNLHAA